MLTFRNQQLDGSRRIVIENQAKFLQLELWNLRQSLWGGNAPKDPIDVLEPGVALKLKGFKIQTEKSLGDMLSPRGSRMSIAGTIDRDNRIVSVSSQFPKAVQFFTLAHELGHALLHPHGSSFHRDIPVTNYGSQKDPEEQEADWFATVFLMPEKQVRYWFEVLFGCKQFALSDETAFALCMKPLDVVERRLRTARDTALALAQARDYGGRRIPHLTGLFRVSAEAMAIRLEQLDLIAEPYAD